MFFINLDGTVLANSPPLTLSKFSFSALLKNVKKNSFPTSLSHLGIAKRLSQTEKRLLLESFDPTETLATSEALSW